MKIQLDSYAHIPTRAHNEDAGLDLYALETQTIPAYGNAIFETGVHIQLPPNTAGLLVSKSGLNTKHDITSTGLIDEGYCGSIKVKLYNHGNTDYKVESGEKISQLVVIPIVKPEIEIVNKVDGALRGDNGFGSSGR